MYEFLSDQQFGSLIIPLLTLIIAFYAIRRADKRAEQNNKNTIQLFSMKSNEDSERASVLFFAIVDIHLISLQKLNFDHLRSYVSEISKIDDITGEQYFPKKIFESNTSELVKLSPNACEFLIFYINRLDAVIGNARSARGDFGIDTSNELYQQFLALKQACLMASVFLLESQLIARMSVLEIWNRSMSLPNNFESAYLPLRVRQNITRKFLLICARVSAEEIESAKRDEQFSEVFHSLSKI